MTTNTIEIEVKIRVDHLDTIKAEIIRLGFQVADPYSFEHNVVFDSPDERLKKNKFLLRLRKLGNRNILTFKRPSPKFPGSENYKVREEIETDAADFDNTIRIFKALGFDIYFIYEKYREIYAKGDVKIMLDHTPCGDFIEIEGTAEDIDKTAALLGYSPADYITDNYLTLFRKEHPTGFMQFARPL